MNKRWCWVNENKEKTRNNGQLSFDREEGRGSIAIGGYRQENSVINKKV
jgi:hypothetical protein